MAIQNLASTTALSSTDKLAIFSTLLGTDAAATLATLATWLQSQLTASSGLVTQYSAPAATGFSVQVAPASTGGSVYLLLTPAAGYAAGTITLPAQASCIDCQEVLVSCTQSIGTLTIAGNGSTVTGAPTAISANGFFRLRFDGVFKAWYRAG